MRTDDEMARDLVWGIALVDQLQAIVRDLNRAFPGLCERSELHRLVDEAIDR